MRPPLPRLVLTLSVLACAPVTARAEVTLNPLFADGMVLQQEMPVPVWGAADDGEEISIHFQNQEAKTTAQDGRWLVRLQPLKAGGPFEMVVEGSKPKVEKRLRNVLVGEVWVCSGQSNMAFALPRASNGPDAIAHSSDSQLRLLTIPRATSDTPLSVVKLTGASLRPGEENWKEAGPATTRSFSAVAYFFGRDLRKALNVPVGLIHSSVGGTPAEAWTPRSYLEADPELRVAFDNDARLLAQPRDPEKYEAEKKAYQKAVAEAKAAGKPAPRAPRAPYGPNNPQRPTVLYNAMIAPLQPFAIRGVIWYQGEGNSSRAYQYQSLFSTMIKAWRDGWKQGDFPFLFVQIAPYQKIVDRPTESVWAELRDAQRKTSQTVPNTAMAVITDCGDESDIHPTRKEPVGARLALAARALVYGHKIESSGPEYAGLDVEKDRAILRFKHLGGGLEPRDGPLTGFTISGEDHTFYNAEAEIQGDTIVVRSPKVEHPVAVRYGWADYPLGNLWNKAGLPASPFRTDDFPMVSVPRPAKPRGAAR